MATLTRGNFADLLDPRFQMIWDERFTNLPTMIDTFYRRVGGNLLTERFSTIGTTGDVPQFTGTVSYDDVSQGYDTTLTALEFALGIQIERRLFDAGQFGIIDQKPRALAGSFYRTREAHAARMFNNAFAVDTFFYSNSEGVPLCSNSHTTTSPTTSTATGFDNLVTTAMSATAVASARIQMVTFLGDRGEKIAVNPDTLVYPPDLYETAYEIVASSGKVDTALNNQNVHMGKYNGIEWNYLDDTNNWFMMDMGMNKDFGWVWKDEIESEMAFMEDFDTLVGKWRSYGVWGNAWIDWRPVLGAQVS